MRQAVERLTVPGSGRGLADVTQALGKWVGETGIRAGLLTVFVPHTSASILIQENADPNVLSDIEAFFGRLVPDGDPAYTHRQEGPDDMPAHIRTALTQVQVSVPVLDGALALGTWQSVFLFEHRTQPRTRELVVHLAGE